MKVLHVGDIASVGYQLCSALRARGVEADLISKKKSLFSASKDEPWVFYAENPWEEFQLCRADLSQYDLVHVHYLINWGSLGSSFKKIKGKVILHCHGCDVRPATFIHQWIQRKVAGKGQILLHSTPDLLAYTLWFTGARVYLPNPSSWGPLKAKITKYKKKALIFATLYKVKQIEKIFPLIEKLDYDFDVIDNGPDSGFYKSMAPKNVHFIPPINQENVALEISKYGLILGGSFDGTMRMCELQAMALGIPTVFPFRFNNFYEEPLPMPEINSENIERSFGDEKLGSRQAQWVKKYHGIDTVVEKLLGIYRKAV